ncbi:MAG: hypothetical protein ACR2O0_14135 [Rhizobiaceae bacterium]
MFRNFLVIMLIVVGVMQGIAIGNIDFAEASGQSGEPMVTAELVAASTDCCDKAGIISNIPTFCQLDCKALIPLGQQEIGNTQIGYEWKRDDNHNSYAGHVDVGPPKSWFS